MSRVFILLALAAATTATGCKGRLANVLTKQAASRAASRHIITQKQREDQRRRALEAAQRRRLTYTRTRPTPIARYNAARTRTRLPKNAPALQPIGGSPAPYRGR